MDNDIKFPLQLLKNIKGQQLESFLIAYEGWRRGLKLTWYSENENNSIFNLPVGITGCFFSLSNNESTHFFFRTRGDKVSNEGLKIGRDKNSTKELLEKNNVSVPMGKKFRSLNKKDIFEYANKIGYPIVLKPLDSSMGKGVFCDIQDASELETTYSYFIQNYNFKHCIIEKQYYGEEHRIYVVGDEAVSCINRKQAFVITDGVHNIRQLIDIKNQERIKNPYLRDKPIRIDKEIETNLAKQNLDLDTVYDAEIYIKLRNISNLSKGGEPHEVSNKISTEIKSMAVRALKSLPNVAHGGVDIIINPDDNNKGTVIEVNTIAEIVFHFYPLSGESVQIPSKIIDYYFPETKNFNRSNFYFDYLDIKKTLDSGQIKSLTLDNYQAGKIHETLITIKVPKVTGTRMNIVRYSAIKEKFSGTIKKADDKIIDLKLLHTDVDIKDFVTNITNKISGEITSYDSFVSETTFHLCGFYTIKKK